MNIRIRDQQFLIELCYDKQQSAPVTRTGKATTPGLKTSLPGSMGKNRSAKAITDSVEC